MDTKCANPTLQLDVDVMTIDFLIHDALQTILKEGIAGAGSESIAVTRLGMVDDALKLFNSHHPTSPDLPDLDFRLELLQFTTLFCRRPVQDHLSLTQSRLRQMRLTNERRRTSWIWCHTPDGHIDAQRADVSVMKHLPATNLLLLDLLPLFMSLCAVRADADPSSYWFHMAAEFMLQAVIECGLDIEGFLTIGPGMRMIEAEAFAWGCSENTTFDNDADINPAMFWDYDNDGPITQWTEIREEYRAELKSPSGVDLLAHLISLRKDHPIETFNKIMISFLSKLSTSIKAPLLVELQGTKVTGLTEAETSELKLRCGLSG